MNSRILFISNAKLIDKHFDSLRERYRLVIIDLAKKIFPNKIVEVLENAQTNLIHEQSMNCVLDTYMLTGAKDKLDMLYESINNMKQNEVYESKTIKEKLVYPIIKNISLPVKHLTIKKPYNRRMMKIKHVFKRNIKRRNHVR
jgi:hypothetical protein